MWKMLEQPKEVECEIANRRVEEAFVLIVDDEQRNVLLLQRLLEAAGFDRLTCLTDPRDVQAACMRQVPDLILLDLHMPNLDGFAVLDLLNPLITDEGYLPVLVLTADITQQAKRRALAAGAMDFLTKPFDAEEVVLRTKNLVRTRLLHLVVREQNALLDERVRLRTRELEEAQVEILDRLALTAEYRDDDTGEHTKRVGDLSSYIARALGLGDEMVDMIRLAAPLHDLGKVGVPDSILHKPGKLSPEEIAVVKEHCAIGAKILTGGS